MNIGRKKAEIGQDKRSGEKVPRGGSRGVAEFSKEKRRGYQRSAGGGELGKKKGNGKISLPDPGVTEKENGGNIKERRRRREKQSRFGREIWALQITEKES